ncbi:hypothetical protein GIB67_041694, partial [Kingdonia uniflora]
IYPITLSLFLSLYCYYTISLKFNTRGKEAKTIIVSKGSHCTKRNYCTRGNPNSSLIPEETLSPSLSLSYQCKYYLILFLL